VADAILHAAEHPTRDLYVGSASRAISTLGQNMPGLADRMAGWLFRQQRGGAVVDGGSDSLYEGGGSHSAEQQVGRRSMYTKMAVNQPSTSLVAAAVVIGGAACWLLRSRR